MGDRIEAQMHELMQDLYDAFADPDAVLNPPAADATPALEGEAYFIEVPSKSKGVRRYDATKLSHDTDRNMHMLALTCAALVAGIPAPARRESALRFAHAIIDSFA